MRGMLLHMDGSTHEWIKGLPYQDLNTTMDDADGQILDGEFVVQEGTKSTLMALDHVLSYHGRFCELYHDCGSHFGRTSKAGQGPDEEQNGQVTRTLRTLGIRQIFARSPQARGRSERAFGTIQDHRIVRNDNTVTYKNTILQIPKTPQRIHYVRCPVTVHEFTNGNLGISYQNRLLGEYLPDGDLIVPTKLRRKAA